MSFRLRNILIWITGGLIAGTSVYIAIRLAPQEAVSLRVRIGCVVMAAALVALFGLSLTRPGIWRLFGAELPKRTTAAATGTIVAIVLLGIITGISIWLMRDWL